MRGEDQTKGRSPASTEESGPLVGTHCDGTGRRWRGGRFLGRNKRIGPAVAIVGWNIVELALDFHRDGEADPEARIGPLAQHFLLSPAARTLSLKAIMRMDDAEAFGVFQAIRFANNGGEPFCPRCGAVKVYTLAETPIRWKCAACRRKFSVTLARCSIRASWRSGNTSRRSRCSRAASKASLRSA
jgi:hypothetical protein